MALNIVRASSQSIQNAAPPLTVYPFTWGALVKPSSLANTMAFLSYLGTFNVDIGVTDSGGYKWWIGHAGENAVGGAPIAGAWSYLLYRGISSTNRRLSVVENTGAISHIQGTVNDGLTAFTKMVIGDSADPFWIADVAVAETFIAGADIQPDGGVLDEALLRQLAYRGPFSVPSIKKDLLEYRSFRQHPTANRANETWFGKRGIQTWTNNNGVTIGPHVPLRGDYVRPLGGDRVVPIFINDTPAPAASGGRRRGGFIVNVGGLMGR